MKKYDVGVIVGRFQVCSLTAQHKKLIDTVVAQSHKVIIFLGVSHIYSVYDPLDFVSRKQMLEKEISSSYNDIVVLPLKDCYLDSTWSENLDAAINTVCTVVDSKKIALFGGRDSFIKHYSGKYATIELHMLDGSYDISGTTVRENASKFPINDSDWRAGVIWARYNDFPKVIPTVDIAVVNENKILLGRKTGDSLWRLPGGFVDSNDESLEIAASRELFEETSLKISPGDLNYIGSYKINDYRYTKSNDSILTNLFFIDLKNINNAGWSDSSVNTANTYTIKESDDLEEVKWFDLNPDVLTILVQEHKKLIERIL